MWRRPQTFTAAHSADTDSDPNTQTEPNLLMDPAEQGLTAPAAVSGLHDPLHVF